MNYTVYIYCVNYNYLLFNNTCNYYTSWSCISILMHYYYPLVTHIDSIKYCGNTIASVSLLSQSVLRLVYSTQCITVLLPWRSLYIINEVRTLLCYVCNLLSLLLYLPPSLSLSLQRLYTI